METMNMYVEKAAKTVGSACAAAGVISVAISGVMVTAVIGGAKCAKDAVYKLLADRMKKEDTDSVIESETDNKEVAREETENDIVEAVDQEKTEEEFED